MFFVGRRTHSASTYMRVYFLADSRNAVALALPTSLRTRSSNASGCSAVPDSYTELGWVLPWGDHLYCSQSTPVKKSEGQNSLAVRATSKVLGGAL